jgi:hypothetical protein
MPKDSVREHMRRFAGWPTLPTVTGAYMPEHDGDMQQLDDLAELIFEGLDDLMRYWPDDRAAELLAIWRAQLDGIA